LVRQIVVRDYSGNRTIRSTIKTERSITANKSYIIQKFWLDTHLFVNLFSLDLPYRGYSVALEAFVKIKISMGGRGQARMAVGASSTLHTFKICSLK
jgi:hypothetical protein